MSLVINRSGVVKLDEAATDDVSYGHELASNLTHSFEQSTIASHESCRRTAWSSYRALIRNNSLRYESTKPREFGVASYIAVSPGRKEPKRGC